MAGVELATLPIGVLWFTQQAGSLAPAAGATAYVYSHGTQSQIQVYADEGLTVPLAQPLVADAKGTLPGYIDAGPGFPHLGAIFDVVATYGGLTLPTMMGNAMRGDETASTGIIPSSQQAGSYTFAATDIGTVVEATSATAVTFTIPPHTSVVFPIGGVIEVLQYGAGQVTIAAGAGVTLRSDGVRVRTAAQFATAGLRQRATDEWVLSGDLA